MLAADLHGLTRNEPRSWWVAVVASIIRVISVHPRPQRASRATVFPKELPCFPKGSTVGSGMWNRNPLLYKQIQPEAEGWETISSFEKGKRQLPHAVFPSPSLPIANLTARPNDACLVVARGVRRSLPARLLPAPYRCSADRRGGSSRPAARQSRATRRAIHPPDNPAA